MKKVNLVMAFAVLMLAIVACGGNSNQTPKTEAPDMHTSENSLDFYGMYEGILPCADCSGIKTKLIINKDKTFVLQSEYVGKDKAVFENAGNFIIENDIIHLDLGNSEVDYYKIQEGSLKKLDKDMKAIEGDLAPMYILKQTEVQP